MGSNLISRISLAPRIRKDQFDEVATEFLTEYCPEVLLSPMAVPIEEIARKKMGLRMITRFRLTEDFSVYGMICFTSGLATIYDRDEDEYRDIKVRRGTILIDADILEKRNIGCFRNTIAHECVHWYKHRKYHFYNYGAGNSVSVSYRYPVIEKDEQFQDEWTDDDWMEWQANGIAPRILMPRQTFTRAVEQIYDKNQHEKISRWKLIDCLAELYQVSKQSADIRCNELDVNI